MNIGSDAPRRRALILQAVLLCAVWVYVGLPGQAAGEDKKPAAAANAAKDDAATKKAAGPEKPAAGGDTAAPAGDAEPAKTPENKSFLIWVAEVSGLIGVVILLLSIYFVSTVARLFWEMRVEVAAPPETVTQCEGLLERRDFKGVYALVKEDESFFGRLLTTGIADLPNGLAEARDSMERMGETITADMEKKISMLAVLGTLGPMIGLLGTLKGMIATFAVIGMSAGSTIDPTKVANGLSESLVLTFEGVALSVPAIYFYALFRNRVIHISTSVMLSADQFLRHFSHAGRVKSPAAPPPKPTL